MSKIREFSQATSNARYLMQWSEEVLPSKPKDRKFHGLFLITEDALGVADSLADILIYNGAFAYILGAHDCQSEQRIIEEIARAREIFGKVNGVIHLAGLKSMKMPKESDAWKHELEVQCKSFFHILRACYDDIEGSAYSEFSGIITCSLLGGYYGRDCGLQPGLPIAGGGQGLLKSLEYEWNSVLTKTIDFDLVLSPEEIGNIILNELSYTNGNNEVGYPMGKRVVFNTYAAELERKIHPIGLKPTKGSVILATGGARGITAETIKLLSNEGNQMILVGRSKLMERSDFLKYEHLDESAIRRELIMEAKNSTIPMGPKLIESKIRKIISDRERRQNIADLHRVGNRVRYVSCDVSDEQEFSQLIKSIYDEFGKIDIVIHGAGIIMDHLLRDKDSISLGKVIDTKVNSAFLLYSLLKWDSLKAFVLFSSTAGRYGNKGQSGYAAANEILNRLAWRIRSEHPNVVVKALNWGPWSGAGMASGVVNEQFIDRGIIPIDVKSGTRYFMGELMHGAGDEIEIILGEGTWNPDRENLLKQIFNIDLPSIGIH